MGYFRTAPNVLRAQREELEAAHRDLCLGIAEVGQIVRRLETMSGLDEIIRVLRSLEQAGTGQAAKLRENAGVLGLAAELYMQTELQSLEEDAGQPASVRAVLMASSMVYNEYAMEMIISPAAMLPNAEALYGTKVLISRRDGKGG